MFAGGFTLDAAENVCVDDPEDTADPQGIPASNVLDLLSDLVDKSMVLVAERGTGQLVRYRLLEPIRQYALEHLRESGGEAAARDRHLKYYVDLAEQAELKLQSESQKTWLRRLASCGPMSRP